MASRDRELTSYATTVGRAAQEREDQLLPTDAERAKIFQQVLGPGGAPTVSFNLQSTSALNSAMGKMLGFARTEIGPGHKPAIGFSSTNNRTLNLGVVSRMSDEMIWDGVKNVSLESVIHVVIKPNDFADGARERLAKWKAFDDVKSLDARTADEAGWPKLAHLLKKNVSNVDGLGGQHRSHAIKTALERAEAYIEESLDKRAKLVDKVKKAQKSAKAEQKSAKPASERVAERELASVERDLKETEQRMAYLNKMIENGSWWLIAVYDACKHISSCCLRSEPTLKWLHVVQRSSPRTSGSRSRRIGERWRSASPWRSGCTCTSFAWRTCLTCWCTGRPLRLRRRSALRAQSRRAWRRSQDDRRCSATTRSRC